jgi:hypothetical protein
MPHEVFALLERNQKLTSRIEGLVQRATSSVGVHRVVRSVECRGNICRVSLETRLGSEQREYDTAIAALQGSTELALSLAEGLAWGPIEYRRDPETGRDDRVVPLYLALKQAD